MKIITLITMEPLNIFAYILAVLFIILLTHVFVKKVRENRQQKQILKQHREYEKNEKELRSQGLKKFTFNKGKTVVWSTDYKSATAQYQTSRKNGK